jgi:small GTP-binding protein
MSNTKRRVPISAKMVLLGDSAVGKSSIVLRLTKNSFSEFGESTIGAAYLVTSIETESAVVKFELWDTAGQERYNAIAPMFYRNAAAALVVFDITQRSSLERAKRWIVELQGQPGSTTLVVLVGNKCDCEHLRQVPQDVAEAYAQEVGVQYFETSAKTNTNITEIFQNVAEKLASASTGRGKAKPQPQQTIVVDTNDEPSRGCC